MFQNRAGKVLSFNTVSICLSKRIFVLQVWPFDSDFASFVDLLNGFAQLVSVLKNEVKRTASGRIQCDPREPDELSILQGRDWSLGENLSYPVSMIEFCLPAENLAALRNTQFVWTLLDNTENSNLNSLNMISKSVQRNISCISKTLSLCDKAHFIFKLQFLLTLSRLSNTVTV